MSCQRCQSGWHCDSCVCCNILLAGQERQRQADERRAAESAALAAANLRIAELNMKLTASEGQRDTALMNLARVKGERDAYKRELQAEIDGSREMRTKHGADDDETLPEFVDRMVDNRDVALGLLRERNARLADAETARDTALREVAAWKAKAETAWEKLDRDAEERIARHADLAALRERLGEAAKLLRANHEQRGLPWVHSVDCETCAWLDAETKAAPPPGIEYRCRCGWSGPGWRLVEKLTCALCPKCSLVLREGPLAAPSAPVEPATLTLLIGKSRTPFRVRRWRADGWPICPSCGLDELMSVAIPATPETVCTCYLCGPVDVSALPEGSVKP